MAFAAGSGPNAGNSCISVAHAAPTPTGIAWTNPGNAQQPPTPTPRDDNAYATSALAQNQISRWLQCTGFGFSIAADQTLDGVFVEVQGKSSTANRIRDALARLIVAGVVGTNDRSFANYWSTADAVYPHPAASSTDLWGYGTDVLTPAAVNGTNFGFALAVTNNGTGTRTGSVDWVQITLFHYPPKGRIYATGFDAGEPEGDWTITGTTPTWSRPRRGLRAFR